MKHGHSLSVIAAAILLSACAANKKSDTIIAEESHQNILDQRNERIEKEINALPEWMIKTPNPDTLGVYGTGMGQSSNLQNSMRKAKLNAEFAVAKQMQQALTGSERLYNTDNSAISQERYVTLIDKIIDEVQVVGYSVEEQDIKAVNGQFVTYTLVKLPYEEFNKALSQQKKDSLSKEMVSAFDDLERRVNERRKRDRDDQQHQVDLANQQIDQRLKIVGDSEINTTSAPAEIEKNNDSKESSGLIVINPKS